MHNRKCNGTVAQVESMVHLLNAAGEFPVASEVVIAVPSIHLARVRTAIRPDIAISSEVSGEHFA